ncbi:toprim domain-containing protein [Pseudomonas sp. GX19020]|uniref:DUF7146 domain-containing protein n=1 Tax=Pseudomonas sp. GX19020 TaxID=2942277 RepID=UPI002019FCCF|nr:toprim domain-containing protein [Pseudomonas sp. GX19020]MCL4068908.1 toprim domain-containing protein [Pseudomonas sp. GX19020]
MPRLIASDIAARLGRQAEAVCRHYLPAGRKTGRYWIVGNVHNAPGRSMFVRLVGPDTGKGAAGNWQDAGTGDYGDLLDIIKARCGLPAFREVANEAARFLGKPLPPPIASSPSQPRSDTSSEFGHAARRLFRMSHNLSGSLAETYLRSRGLTHLAGVTALRFHPRCFYKPDGGGLTEQWPALLAAVTDLKGRQTGTHRTWLARNGAGKAPLDPPRRAMGDLLGHGVRFGSPRDVLAVGEGIESVLSVREALPVMPMMAALSAGHLAAVLLSRGLKRLYIICDRDPAGERAADRLANRAFESGIEPVLLMPMFGDFNDDLQRLGRVALRAHLLDQVHPEDRHRFLCDGP